MPHPYKYLIIATILLATLAVLGFRNDFSRAGTTFVRFVAAIIVAWLLIILSRFVIVAVDLSLAETQAQLQHIRDGDGAKNAFVLAYGWMPALLMASAAWVVARLWRWFRC